MIFGLWRAKMLG